MGGYCEEKALIKAILKNAKNQNNNNWSNIMISDVVCYEQNNFNFELFIHFLRDYKYHESEYRITNSMTFLMSSGYVLVLNLRRNIIDFVVLSAPPIRDELLGILSDRAPTIARTINGIIGRKKNVD